MRTGKVWGITEALWDQGIEVHRLEIIPDYHCSWHIHQHKANAFFVFEGKLYIERKKSYGLIDVTELRPGDFTVVPAPEEHRFVTRGEGCRALEIYYPMPLSNDIIRKDNGGPNELMNNSGLLGAAKEAARQQGGPLTAAINARGRVARKR